MVSCKGSRRQTKKRPGRGSPVVISLAQNHLDTAPSSNTSPANDRQLSPCLAARSGHVRQHSSGHSSGHGRQPHYEATQVWSKTSTPSQCAIELQKPGTWTSTPVDRHPTKHPSSQHAGFFKRLASVGFALGSSLASSVLLMGFSCLPVRALPWAAYGPPLCSMHS